MEESSSSTQPNLADSCFQDVNWLIHFPLVNSPAVLHYFAISPFFDAESNNQTLLNQNREQKIEFLREMKGTEFIVNEEQSQPLRLFIIQKQYRSSPFNASVVEVFYCLDGSIFQCQNLLAILKIRYEKAAVALLKAYHCLFEEENSLENSVKETAKPAATTEQKRSER